MGEESEGLNYTRAAGTLICVIMLAMCCTVSSFMKGLLTHAAVRHKLHGVQLAVNSSMREHAF